MVFFFDKFGNYGSMNKTINLKINVVVYIQVCCAVLECKFFNISANKSIIHIIHTVETHCMRLNFDLIKVASGTNLCKS